MTTKASDIQPKPRFQTYSADLAGILFMHPTPEVSEELVRAASWHILNCVSILNVALEMIEDPAKKRVVVAIMDSFCEKPLPKSPVSNEPDPTKP